jgi:superfamily II DNA or RNA helicase
VTAHPNYEAVTKALGSPALERDQIVRLQREIDQMNVMSSIYTRTRKRDVTGIAKRQAYVINVPITDAEQAFYDAVLADARAQARQKSATGVIPGWTGMMRERQAASCMTATREYLMALHRDRMTSIQIEDSSTDVAPDTFDSSAPEQRQDEVGVLLEAAKALGSTDSKFDRFEEALRSALEESTDSKVIVFSYFRRTLNYLDRQLRSRGYDVLQINGDVPPDQRAIAIDRFRYEPKLQILLTSEVGAEGLDFQFCDTLFNYDLPWNPMRVEQRIGRIDRYGQTRDKIRIYSFFLQGTIEERILERLYLRIGIFEDSIGDLEPILGPLSNALTREIFSAELTPAEEAEIATRYANQVLNRREDERELENRSAELLGQDELIRQAVQETVAAGRYISTAELRAAVEGFLQDVGAVAELIDEDGDGAAMLVADGKIAAAVDETVLADRDSRPGSIEFLSKLRRSARIPVTFDGETAMVSRRIELLNMRHPLVRTAIAHVRKGDRARLPVVDLVATSDLVDGVSGSFTFGIFMISVTGAQAQTRLIGVALDEQGRRAPDIERRLLSLIQESASDGPRRPWSAEERDAIVANMTRMAASDADQIEAEARDRNDAILAVRKATLERTLRGKIAKRNAQIAGAVEERVRRMWQGEVRNLEQELARRLDELEARRAVGVTYASIGVGKLVLSPSVVAGVNPDPAIEHVGPVAVDAFPEPPPGNLPWT